MIETLSTSDDSPLLRRSSAIHCELAPVEGIRAYHYRPDGAVDRPTILIAPGWGEGTRVLDIAARALASGGRHVVTFDHRRVREARSNPSEYKASTLGAVYDYAVGCDDDTRIVAHSEGAISTVKMLRERQNKATMPRSVVLTAPAGYIGQDDWLDLLRRTFTREGPAAVRGNLRPLGRQAVQAVAESLTRRYHVIRNLDLGMREAKSIASTDLVPDTVDLWNQGGGVNFTLLACRKDEVFPYDLMYKHAQPLRDLGAIRWEEADVAHHEFLANRGVLEQINDLV